MTKRETNRSKMKSNDSNFRCFKYLKLSCKKFIIILQKIYNYKKLNSKLGIAKSFLIWLKRIKSLIKVFEDTLVKVTNS